MLVRFPSTNLKARGLSMYARILVPLDGAKFSEEVLPHAAGLARVHGTTLTLLRIVEKESDGPDAEAYVKALAERLSAQALCVVARTDVADVIVEEAARVPKTLVTMTSHGRTGLMEAMLGSVALRVVRNSGAPVLVYRPRGADAPDRAPVKVTQIVLPLDGTPTSEAMAPHAAEFAKWLDAELVVVSVSDFTAGAKAGFPQGDVMDSSYVRGRAKDFAGKYGVRVSWEALHGEPAEAIVQFVDGRPGAILAMTTRGHQAIKTAFLGSVTAGCLRKAGVPVLARMP
ncbi:MAG: universal stress protein [Rhizobacter sp.]|nr:universal stress protein [Rhizobacter sp.]